jgi:hypothetical protein
VLHHPANAVALAIVITVAGLLSIAAATAQTYPDAPRVVDQHGRYHGRVTNRYDPDSVTNTFGRYGNPYSPDSINNQFGTGNPYNGLRFHIEQ